MISLFALLEMLLLVWICAIYARLCVIVYVQYSAYVELCCVYRMAIPMVAPGSRLPHSTYTHSTSPLNVNNR